MSEASEAGASGGREPIAEAYDAIVDFYPPESMPDMVYGLVKLTYDLIGDQAIPAKVEPLYHDIRLPETEPRWSPGSDFWPMKMQTDVVVRGSAFAPGGAPVPSQMIRVTVGGQQKLIAVFGDRAVDWPARGDVRFGPPKPYTQMPIVWGNAYGGYDPRVPVGSDEMTVAMRGRLEYDHPGVYPRNPFGKGYVVVDEPAPGLSLPNLEDPQQLLRPETLITGDPRRWYLQPLPACYEFTNAMMFPRNAWLGVEAWFHPPSDAPLREVLLGALPTNWHELPVVAPPDPLPPPVLQEGPIGLVFPPLEAGTPIIIEGMHPERPHVGFHLPRAPKLDFFIEGKVYASQTQLTTVLIQPDLGRASLTYVARHWDLPRVFVPGIHANIPLALVIDDQHTVPYLCPPTLREQVKAGSPGQAGPERA
ncbi:putative exported protein [Enhygromyxa salina]|uniref:Putative exported protein n=1 Tax=Enhygromyxa salina TaxID=215803 RepID=A0A0C2D5X5_9BACT|nr:DUF2169 domain-containing protein [Enhygromyxa salina]KIG18571.1 putative exported protein [Enhygromyxa salina]